MNPFKDNGSLVLPQGRCGPNSWNEVAEKIAHCSVAVPDTHYGPSAEERSRKGHG